MAYKRLPNNTCLVYCVTCASTGKKYIGMTNKTLGARWAEHVYVAGTKKSRSIFHKAIRKYGVTSFTVTCVHTATSRPEAETIERELIALYNTRIPRGYNIAAGGDGGPLRLGSTTPPEVRAKQSAAAKGKIKSQAHRRALSLAHTGKKHSPEHIAKIKAGSSKNRGPTHNPQQSLKHRIELRRRSIDNLNPGTSGLVGVQKAARHKGWSAIMYVDKKRRRIGTFPTPEQARVAFLHAAKTDLQKLQIELAALHI